jgi:hypothetical protein
LYRAASDQFPAFRSKHRVVIDKNCAGTFSFSLRENWFELINAACAEKDQVNAKRFYDFLKLLVPTFVCVAGCSVKESNGLDRWYQLMKDFQALRNQFGIENKNASHVSTRSVQAFDISACYRIKAGSENDWDRFGGRFGCNGRWPAARNDGRDLTLNQFLG